MSSALRLKASMTFWYAPASAFSSAQALPSLSPEKPPTEMTTSPPAARMALICWILPGSFKVPDPSHTGEQLPLLRMKAMVNALTAGIRISRRRGGGHRGGGECDTAADDGRRRGGNQGKRPGSYSHGRMPFEARHCCPVQTNRGEFGRGCPNRAGRFRRPTCRQGSKPPGAKLAIVKGTTETDKLQQTLTTLRRGSRRSPVVPQPGLTSGLLLSFDHARLDNRAIRQG